MKDTLYIVLLEDNPGDAELIRGLLSTVPSTEFHISHFDRLTEAIKYLEIKSADLVLLDLSLPDSRGLDSVHRIRSTAPWVPIVVLTGNSETSFGVQIAEAGAQDFLVKDKVTADLLVRVILYAIERHKNQEALRTSEEQLRLVIDNSPNAVFMLDSDGRYLLVNDTLANLYQKAKAEMLGETGRDISKTGIPGTNIVDLSSGIKDESEIRTGPFTMPDGEVRLLQTTLKTVTSLNRQTCTLGISTDITPYFQAQETIRDSELRLRAILDAQQSRVLLLDPQLRILWPNKAACEDAGLPSEQMIGHHCHEIWEQDTKTCQACPVVKALETGKTTTSIRTTPDGRTWRVHGCPVWDNRNRIVSVVELTEDITERLHLEDQLRQAQKMESLGTLAGGIAHDFNNILSGILGFTELAMAKTNEPDALQSYLHEAYKAGLRAADLVGQILTFSRRTDTELRPLDISTTIKEALKLLRSTLPTTIEMDHYIENDLALVLADPTQIHQIIMNLCTNANHAMEPKGGKLEVRLTKATLKQRDTVLLKDLQPGNYLKLTVSDTGCGMLPDIKATIFDPYFTTKDLGEGTGLGLSVVHGIVKEYGGDITVDSTPEKGSTFTIFFPTVTRKAHADKSRVTEFLPRGNERILIIDDEPSILKICSRLLERQGYTITTENDSERALARFTETPDAYDLVLTDVTMPKLTGDQLARKLLSIRPGIPIILCTGYTKLISKEQALEMGIYALINKPVVRNQLVTEIRNALDSRTA